jgi:alkylation response protein AidB-like acyl-CoA dehydrogenase
MLPFKNEHNHFRTRLRQFLKDNLIPHIHQWESDRIIPRQIWRKMGAEGFLGTCVEKKFGGIGGDFLYSLIVAEETARANILDLAVYLHNDMVIPYIDTFGNAWQKEKFLPGCVSGDRIAAIAMTEPDAGSDLAAMTTTAIDDGDEVIIDGAKTFISNGVNSDLIVLAAKNPEIENQHKAISLYLVEADTPGFKKGRQISKMGMHSQDTAELFFSNCRIPKRNQLGEKGRGFFMLMQKLQQERLIIAIMSIAAAEYVLNWALRYYFQGSNSISGVRLKSQAIEFAFAEMAADIRIGKTFVYNIVKDHMKAKERVTDTSIAKFWATDMVKRISGRVLGLLGDDGIDDNHPIVKMWRDVQVYSIFAGTNEIMKTIVSKDIFK